MEKIKIILQSKPHNNHYLNRYIKLLNAFITNNKNKNFKGEYHHICPKSSDLFPEYSKSKFNIVKLTYRQHFICHLLLAKIYGGSQIYALWAMCNNQSPKDKKRNRNLKINSKKYSKIREQFIKLHSQTIKGRKNPSLSSKMKGLVSCQDKSGNYFRIPIKEFHNRNDLFAISKNNKLNLTKEQREKISLSHKNRIHIFHPINNIKKFITQEELENHLRQGFILGVSGSYKRTIIKCKYCKKELDQANFKRWHGENCKFKNLL